jgi:4-hydroxy-tetrahydrodipicolinate synthase
MKSERNSFFRSKEAYMKKALIYPEGSWVAVVTPFDSKGKVDMEGFKRLIDLQAANGTSGLLLMGSTGEPTSLTQEERKEIIQEMTPYCHGKIPVFFGVTSGSTAMTSGAGSICRRRGC